MEFSILHSIERDVLENMGSPIRVLEACKNLSKRKGMRIFVNSGGHIKHEELRKIGKIEVRRHPFAKLRTIELRTVFNALKLYSLNKRVLMENDLDIIHSHLFESSCIASLIKKKYNIPFIYDMHTLFPEEILVDSKSYTHKIRTLLWSPAEDHLRRTADHVVATSDTMRDYLYKRGLEDVTSVPVGVNTDFFTPSPKNKEIMDKYGLDGKNVVIYTGNTNPYQGVGDLVESMPFAVKENRDIVFLLVGGGEYLDYYKKRARVLGVEDNAIFTGPVEYRQMPHYLSVADIALSLRTFTFTGNITFPTKLTTYMAAGKPSICTNVGDQGNILKKWDVGYLVESKRPKQLAEKIVHALSSKNELQKMGRNARSVAINEFSWDVLCERYIKIYREILEN